MEFAILSPQMKPPTLPNLNIENKFQHIKRQI